MYGSELRTWRPLALRRPALLAFALFFAAVAISFGTVYKVSAQHQGLAKPETQLRYFWTYVPSLFFVVTSGIWAAVCYNTKSLAPWKALMQGPVDGAKSLSLDYTSKNQFITFYRSWKNGHWSVTLAVAGALCLDLLVIVSTGLFRFNEFAVYDSDFRFPLLTKLNKTGQVERYGGGISTAYAIDQYGLQYPAGTRNDFAFSTIDANTMPPESKAHLTVDAVAVDVSCEKANATWTFGLYYDTEAGSVITPGHRVNASTSKCRSRFPGHFVTTALNDTYFFEAKFATCPTSDPDKVTGQIVISVNRMMVTDMDIAAAKLLSVNATWETYSNDTRFFLPVQNKTRSSTATAIMCTIVPYLRNASLTVDRTSTNATLLPANMTELKPLGQNADWESSLQGQLHDTAVFGIFEEAFYLSGTDDWSRPGRTVKLPTASDVGLDLWGGRMAVLFQFMNRTSPRASVRDFLDADYLIDAAQKTFKPIATQLLAEHIFPKTQEKTVGRLSFTERRLVASAPAFGAVIGLCTLMVAFSVTLFALRQVDLVKDPGSIASKATILARSPDVISLARSNAGSSNNKRLFAAEHFRAGVSYDGGQAKFSIEALEKHDSFDTTSLQSLARGKDWCHPWSTAPVSRALAIAIPCFAIALLEGLLVKSERRQGVANVPHSNYAQYGWVYVPVLVVSSMNIIFTAISSTNRIIQPYVAMAQGPSPAARSLYVDLVNRITVSALWQALKLRYLGTAASILATLLGATLPIAASGLYKTQSVQRTQPVSLRQTTSFDPALSLTTKLAKEDFLPVPGLILYQNLSFPRWTFGKYALPELAFENLNLSIDKSNQSSLFVDVPAVYGVANCTPIPTDGIKYSGRPSNDPDFLYFVDLNATFGPDCPKMSQSFGVALNEVLPDPMPTDPLQPLDFTFGFWGGQNIRQMNETIGDIHAATYHGSQEYPDHCPRSVAQFTKGKYYPARVNSTADTIVVDQIVWLSCIPYVNKETVSVKFSLPNFNISPAEPPVPKPGTQSFFSEAELVNNERWEYYLPYRPQAVTLDPKSKGVMADLFFKAVFGGVNGVAPSSFLGPQDMMVKKLQQRIDEVYSIMVAQIYGGKRRFATLPQDAALRFDGTLRTPARDRVRQDKVSTRILQAILAAIVVCVAVSMAKINGRRLLPQTPCSIAGVASLLAYSGVLSHDVIPPGSEFQSDGELRRAGVLEHGLYSLGWWSRGEKRWYGIDMGRGEKDKGDVVIQDVEEMVKPKS